MHSTNSRIIIYICVYNAIKCSSSQRFSRAVLVSMHQRCHAGPWLIEFSYHWRVLPQVQFLSRQKFCHDKQVFVATNHVFCRNFCRDKSFVTTNKSRLLSRQNYVCRNKAFVATNSVCHDKTFATTNILLCSDKRRALS